MQLTKRQIESFRNALFEYYAREGRHDLPWRIADKDGFDPYKIVVSELMLQQTQVSRVIPKYQIFLQEFPSVTALASASLGDVLVAWQGLGYNRRAKFLWQTGKQVKEDFGGKFPDTLPELISLPGIGKNTAGAVLAYAFNQPAIFVETNIRTVYIHHFFADSENVVDSQIQELVAQTLTPDNAREFYWALMDYGTYLKQTTGNKNTQSKHYTKQSPFAGSRRQVRGAVLRALSSRGYTHTDLLGLIADERATAVLAELMQEGFIAQTDDVYHLA